MNKRDRRPTRSLSDRSRLLALAVLALGAQAGCGREFFREWANQDVSEAVFEKSRDPRWRLDMFSVEPPALARFADPYDPDRPPAPPDDRAAEALAPVPQLPDNRLLVPAEGTGYLDMLETWLRERPSTVRTGPTGASSTRSNPLFNANPITPRGMSRPIVPPSPEPAAPPVPPAENPATSPPAAVEATDAANSGTTPASLTPILVPSSQPTNPPATAPPEGPPGPGTDPGRPQAENSEPSLGVMLTAFQQSGLPLPVPTPAVEPIPPSPALDPAPRPGETPNPSIGMDPTPPGTDVDLTKPINPPPGQTREEYLAGEAAASALAGILVPGAIDFNDAEAGGLPQKFRPYIINMQQAFTLALINSRVYQFNLENVYNSALAVTLQRFAFTPQFYAGLSPRTGVAGLGGIGGAFPGTLFPNTFAYATAETGAQQSQLNIGTAAGFGKLFSSGAQLLAGFANQLVFNFLGKNPIQPRVQSFLPLTLVQPLLRGGGRAVTLELLTQAERNLLYQVRLFAKFRQEFTVATLIGGQVQNFGSAVPSLGFTGGGNSDPTVGFVNVLEDVQIVENYYKNIAAFAQLVTVYTELIKGESSGLSQLQLDQVEQGLQNARQTLINFRNQYRSDLDSFKVQMGLPPDTPIIPDRSLTRPFKETFDAIDEWQKDPRRKLKDLPKFVQRLPKLQDVVIDGRSALGVYSEGQNHEDALEDLLLAAERQAMEHRLDLMNQRATLYDVWRQIKFTANALQGFLNVTLTNQFVTPPNTTNPFAFVDQAKQFSLAINAELPLVRLSERNNFRASLINYERQRRTLQSQEDSIKLIIRQDMRAMLVAYLSYEISKKNFILAIRQKDQAFEQIIAPPAATGAGNQAPLQTTNLISFQTSLVNNENFLVTNWYNYQVQRLQLYRDLGTLPFDEWEAFYELFPELSSDAYAPAATRDEGTTRASTAGAEPEAGVVPR